MSEKKIDHTALERTALRYLQRFSSSTESLRRLLHRKIKRALESEDDRAPLFLAIEPIIEKFSRLGYLNDQSYAQQKMQTLLNRGKSLHSARAYLLAKGIDKDVLSIINQELTDDADLKAAIALVKRRRLGPLRPQEKRTEFYRKDSAILARAGFSFEIIRKILNAESLDDIELYSNLI